MIRHILKQIWTQRHRNGWILSELLIVFALAWYIMDYTFVLVHNRMIPNGYDITDTYQILYDNVLSDSTYADFDRFCDRVKKFPGVKAVFVSSGWDITPFSSSYNGGVIRKDTVSEKIHTQQKGITENSYFDVFKIRSVKSGKPARLDFSDYNTVILTENLAKSMFGEEAAIGKTIYIGKREYRITDIIESQKRYDYYQPNNLILLPRKVENMSNPEISIRTGDNFSVVKFKKEVSQDIKPYSTIQKEQEFAEGLTKEVKIRNGIMIFFLLNVALGIIGTFWFRNQTRRNEIGIRMAIGSSRSLLQKQFIGEALLLLTIVVLPALFINAGIVQAGLIKTLGEQEANSGYITADRWLRFFIANGITYILLATIVCLSAWIPAGQASKIHPVEALKDE